MNFAHLVFFVELLHGQKLSAPRVSTLKTYVGQVDQRPRQVVIWRSEKDVETLFRRPIVIDIDHDEAHWADSGEPSYERRQRLLYVAKYKLGVMGQGSN